MSDQKDAKTRQAKQQKLPLWPLLGQWMKPPPAVDEDYLSDHLQARGIDPDLDPVEGAYKAGIEPSAVCADLRNEQRMHLIALGGYVILEYAFHVLALLAAVGGVWAVWDGRAVTEWIVRFLLAVLLFMVGFLLRRGVETVRSRMAAVRKGLAYYRCPRK
ncbi:hypothetical protein [Streptomyces koelreuteriae]|uniref:hypothetical protein n=1 Tax=Streptomyces koelreuteriae TaxID=2838015 RepID=UPI003EBA5A48